jgi:hypothetical protein
MARRHEDVKIRRCEDMKMNFHISTSPHFHIVNRQSSIVNRQSSIVNRKS